MDTLESAEQKALSSANTERPKRKCVADRFQCKYMHGDRDPEGMVKIGTLYGLAVDQYLLVLVNPIHHVRHTVHRYHTTLQVLYRRQKAVRYAFGTPHRLIAPVSDK